jgi:hypothetical protein
MSISCSVSSVTQQVRSWGAERNGSSGAMDAPDSPAMRSGRPGLPSCQTVVEEARAKGEFTGGCASECERV